MSTGAEQVRRSGARQIGGERLARLGRCYAGGDQTGILLATLATGWI